MGRRPGGNRNTPAGRGNSRPGRDRPRPSAGEAARLTRVAGRDRRYAGCPDAGVLLAVGVWGAVESWAAAQKVAAVQEMIRRRPGDPRMLAALAASGCAVPAPGSDALAPVWDKTLGEELALELSSSVYSGQALADLSYALKNRLPRTAAALDDGTLDMGKVRLIASETEVLDDELARVAEADIADRWGGLTWGELRDLVTVAVINADPEGAAKRREEASRDARYRFCLDRGALTATLAGYSLPPADAIRADQRVRARARGYRRHGIDGTFDQLCALAYLDLLTGRDARDRVPQGPAPDQDQDEEAAWDSRLAAGPGVGEDAAGDAVGEPGWDDGWVPDDPDAAALAGVPCPDEPDDPGIRPDAPAPEADIRNRDSRDDGSRDDGSRDDGSRDDGDRDDGDRDGSSHDDDSRDEDGRSRDDDGQDGTGAGGGDGPGGGGSGGSGPGSGGCGCAGGGPAACDDGRAANVDLIVPLGDLAGYAQRAGLVRNLGGIDPDLARSLAVMAARAPGSVFRVIITGPDGRAVAFGQATPIAQAARPAATQTPGDRHIRGTQLPIPDLGPAGDPPDSPGMPLASFTPAPGSRTRVTGPDGYGVWRLGIGGTVYTVRLDPVPGPGPCSHDYLGAGYKPGPVLRRLAEVRDGACMLPGCNRGPRRSESEHCQPWPAGATCSCNLGLTCKKHNLMKQDPQWQVTQKPDGTRTWTTPGGLQYTKKPKAYPS